MRLSVRHGALLTVAVIVLGLERRWRARPNVEPPARHTARNLAMAGVSAATVQLVEMPIVLPLARLVERRQWGLTHALGGPLWLRRIIAVVLLDYTLYLWHVLTHRTPWLWRLHLVHHVDLDLDASTGLRFHAGELAASVPWRAAQIVVIGVTPAALTLWQQITLACVLFHHSNTRFSDRTERTLSRVVATPRMHTIHHSTDPAHLHSNFSSGLSIWDRLHGTALVVEPDGLEVGVAGYLSPPVTFSRALTLPFEPSSPPLTE